MACLSLQGFRTATLFLNNSGGYRGIRREHSRACFPGQMLEESYTYMKESNRLKKHSTLALRKRRRGLARLLPPVEETLRGSLVERYLTCGNLACKCARGKRHGPVWYLTVTLAPGRTTSRLPIAPGCDSSRRTCPNCCPSSAFAGICGGNCAPPM